jgi:hypothetical protein
MNKTRRLLEQHQLDLEKINKQRRIWLYASSVVVLAVVFLIFGWDWMDDHKTKSIWWVFVTSSLVISVNWWYWTMTVIRRLLVHQSTEYDILADIVDDIKDIKDDVKRLNS